MSSIPDDDFFRNLGVEPPGGVDPVADENAERAMRIIVGMVATVFDEALKRGFSSDDAFSLAFAYFQMFLGASLTPPRSRHDGENK